MLKILLVEDKASKAHKIIEAIKSVDGVNEDNVTVVADRITAKKHLVNNAYDLLLLDIEIPNRFDQTPQRDGGLQFLKDIRMSSNIMLPFHIIGITAYEDIYKEVNGIFLEELMALVKYDDSSFNWICQLQNKIRYLVHSKNALLVNSNREYQYDVGIICALEEIEFQSIRRLSCNWEVYPNTNDASIYYTCHFPSKSRPLKIVAAAAPQMGMPAASVLAMKMIHNFTPRYLAMAGVAAGVKGEVNLGDILVADPSWDYGSGKIETGNDMESQTFLPDPQPLNLNPDVKAHIQALASNRTLLDSISNSWVGEKPETKLNVHLGPVASGSAVLAHSAIVDGIKNQHRKLKGIEMETYGFMYAAANCVKPRPVALSIKSACDYADSEKNDKYKKYAAHTSSEFLFHLITECLHMP